MEEALEQGFANVTETERSWRPFDYIPKFVVTTRMAEAGGRVLADFVGDCAAEELACAVFREMIAALQDAERPADGLGSPPRRGSP